MRAPVRQVDPASGVNRAPGAADFGQGQRSNALSRLRAVHCDVMTTTGRRH